MLRKRGRSVDRAVVARCEAISLQHALPGATPLTPSANTQSGRILVQSPESTLVNNPLASLK